MKEFMTEKSHKIVVHHCVWVSFDERNVKNVLYAFLADQYQFQAFITQRKYLEGILGRLPERSQSI
jgi:hypothetical protein